MGQEILRVIVIVSCYIALLFVVLQIVQSFGMKKQKAHFEELHTRLKPGLTVMLTDGIYGEVTQVTQTYCYLRIAKNTEIKVSRFSIKEIIEK